MMYNAGLILEGGAMRGVYTAGVIDYLLDKGISFREVYGVSAGSCSACSYLSGQRRRAMDVCVDYLDDDRYCSVKSLLRTGELFGSQMLYHEIPDKLNLYDYEAFSRYPGNFYAVVTNCYTGQAEYRKVQDLHKDIEVIRASSSMPLVAKMVYLDGKPYLDGGIADSIPLKQSQKKGNQKNVVVLTRDKSYRKKPNEMMPLIRARYFRYPQLVNRIERRHEYYNRTLEEISKSEEAGDTFVLSPGRQVEVGRIEKDRKKLEALYQEGYEEAKARGEELMKFLEGCQ